MSAGEPGPASLCWAILDECGFLTRTGKWGISPTITKGAKFVVERLQSASLTDLQRHGGEKEEAN